MRLGPRQTLSRTHFPRARTGLGFPCGMEVSESVQCPYCGQSMELVLDTSLPEQRFTTDCEVCCRPFEVVAECEPGEILSVSVQG